MQQETSLQSEVMALQKAKNCWDKADAALKSNNYRGAMLLFHRCILMARGIHQDCSVALHQNSAAGISHSVSLTTPLSGVNQSQLIPQQLEQQRIKVEDERAEVTKLISNCYLGLAKCVLNGQARTIEDYKRAAQYCDNVLESHPDDRVALLIKAEALVKAEKFNEALVVLNSLSEDPEVASLIDECNRGLQDKRRRRDEIIQANFARQNNPPHHEPGMNGHALH
ncbi:unnamed protein product [Bursaphelenchus xylophilus]|uniref:(pine wood nematode) hypothetical protein n=1 Tax=Bursaphelenchus xylophilus TaxID=6326 RepID=A0A7I8WWA8_BURXY|nr:unnamed protein product [Bursaphelenchus xylophilus]CAG9098172.1 unnamed protein product [Bursaphelenchus xylophilus]